MTLCFFIFYAAMKKLQFQLPLFLLTTFLIIPAQITSATEFVFNGFDSSKVNLYGNATIQAGVLTLTTDSTQSIGRALYPAKIAAKEKKTSRVLQFSTSFIFAMAPYVGRLPGHGLVFLFVPRVGIQGTSSAQHLGFLNFSNNNLPSNHVFGVEFDVFKNEEFNDTNDNHVGIDVNSLRSVSAYEAGYWTEAAVADDGSSQSTSFKKLKLNDWRNYQAWIDYADGTVNVTMAPAGLRRPKKPLLNVSLNLSEVFEEEMFVGFTASTGALIESHKILSWSFSNTNFSLSEALITRNLPSFLPPKTPLHRRKGFIAGITAGVLFAVITCSLSAFLVMKRNQRLRKEREEMEDWEFEYWPHRISYQEIDSATKRFADENVIGIGGNGKVYKGVFPGGEEVAVKCFCLAKSQGIPSFLAEISSIGRLKHRNLVRLRGWCKKEKGVLMLVYDYMQNGSLDKFLFEDGDEVKNKNKILSYSHRIRILKQVASAILYLHNGWESKVLHRDIKASNVLLDQDMNAKLGDFGLARVHSHDRVAGTTCVVGTIGYLAPEVVKSGRATTKTDVFGYGVLILETICGRRPIEEGKMNLVEWAYGFLRKGALMNVVDARLRSDDGFDEKEVEEMIRLGLACAHQDPNSRPTMRQVVRMVDGKSELDGYGSEELEMLALDTTKSEDFWLSLPQTPGSDFDSHPTFQDLRRESSSSMSNSWSNANVDGR